jgi:Staphylococcal nuclease homologue
MKIQVLLFIVFVLNALSAEIVALVKGIETNHKIHMVYKNQPFICKPYGIESISELILRTDVKSTCMKHLTNFRRSNPKEKYFTQMTLHVQQQYTVEGIGSLCLLHLSSGHSLSEALIEEGYARIPFALKYENFLLEDRFERALQRAKNTKAGMWSDINVRNCFLVTPK